MDRVIDRLCRVHDELYKKNLAGVIVPSNDPHFSEYVAERWKCREWLSGFTGSAGVLALTTKEAALWTDSRYFIQAEEQLKGTGIALKKMKNPGVEPVEGWLKARLKPGDRIGVDKDLFSIAEFVRMQGDLYPLELTPIDDLFSNVWYGRPSFPTASASLLSVSITGESIASKLKRVRGHLASLGTFVYPITALDEIAWLFNLRGADIAFNPLVLAYSVITQDRAYLFVDKHKLSLETITTLKENGVDVCPYESFFDTCKQLVGEKRCVYNPRKITIGLYRLLKYSGYELLEEQDTNGLICSIKSIKNEVEQNGFRKAMIHDGVALVRFQYWLEKQLGAAKVTELTAAEKLLQLRKECDDFVGESFGSIMAYRAHGALSHYSATPDSDVEIKPEGFLLFDTGGQYFYGTTDVTRMLHLGDPTIQEKEDYTQVLKGMISLSMAKFPEGTRGAQLDILARQFLWASGKNFMHGTGHGVGHYLNVHEGPQSIRMEDNPVTFKPGMVTSNEPAIYREGEYGIRIENLILCKPFVETVYGKFLCFETLTLAPIDIKPIDKSMLSKAEIDWLNCYHKQVFELLSPLLGAAEQDWLREKTRGI